MGNENGMRSVWDAACNIIRQESEALCEHICATFEPLVLDNGTLLLGAPDEFTADWNWGAHGSAMLEALSAAYGQELKVDFEYGHLVCREEKTEEPATVMPDLFSLIPEEAEGLDAEDTGLDPVEPVIEKSNVAENCLPVNTFDNFVVGSENQYAFTAAQTAAQVPGRYNPLYIWGGSGMGKTHLIQAVANEVVRKDPAKVVRYITCEAFLNEYVTSLREKSDFLFRDRFRHVDLLLIDDVHFLGGNKIQLQEEFFNTFNTLYNANKQIILTSDKQPSEIPGLEKRLVSRFQNGAAMQITASTFETRLAILRQEQERMETKFSNDVLEFLADRITSNIRPLKGALVRLSVFASAGIGEITVQKAAELLADVLDQEAGARSPHISIDLVQKVVADYCNLQIRDLTGSQKPKHIADARMLAMYLCRKLTNNSQQEIGDAFKRTHATVINAVKQIEKRLGNDESMKNAVQALQRKIQCEVK